MIHRSVEPLFWLSLAVVVYTYAGYPFVVWLFGGLRRATPRKAGFEPFVSILIAAHNEEAVIAQTIRNKLELDYPDTRLEIIVVSDASTDRTDEIARSFAQHRVLVLRQEPRRGKSSALNLAVGLARGEILVFADANSIYEPTALRHLVANFADPDVGYVTGTLAYTPDSRSMAGDGCSRYMRYENFLRRSETRAGSVVGVNGGIDAMRRSLYHCLNQDDLPDLVLPFSVVQAGYRVVYEPKAVAREPVLTRSADEYRMRVRVSLRALWTLVEMRRLLNPFRFGFYSMQILSHKALRYLAGVLLAVCYASSLALRDVDPFYQTAFVLQSLFLLAGALGLASERLGYPLQLLSTPSYFLLVNCAATNAVVKLIRGQRQAVWQPRLG